MFSEHKQTRRTPTTLFGWKGESIAERAKEARLQADTDTLREYSPAIYNDLAVYSAELRNDREERDITRIIERAGGTR